MPLPLVPLAPQAWNRLPLLSSLSNREWCTVFNLSTSIFLAISRRTFFSFVFLLHSFPDEESYFPFLGRPPSFYKLGIHCPSYSNRALKVHGPSSCRKNLYLHFVEKVLLWIYEVKKVIESTLNFRGNLQLWANCFWSNKFASFSARFP